MNGDGTKDLITGHYWPGDIFIFYGKSGGGFEAMQNLKDETGRNLNAGGVWKSEQDPDMQSLAAAPYATDFDGDGDFDMLIGNIVGNIVFIENIGDAKTPKFSTKRTQLTAAGAKIEVGGGDSGPVHVDWDKDGKRDLLTGAGDGSVIFFKNIGVETAPKFAKGIALVPALKNQYGSIPVGQQPVRAASRTKVFVVDYNHDGRNDLLVGDYCSIDRPEPKLTPEQIKTRDALRKDRDAVNQEMDKFFEKLGSGDKMTADEEKEMAEISERFSKIYEELSPLEAGTDSHGFVWLYLAKDGVAKK
ncbi:MAG: VCBS repeat-containing protein [Planctomycetota bacterium]